MINKPNKTEINQMRSLGYRPVVAVSFIHEERVLMLLDEYNLWAFPQGGIENHEEVENAVLREIREEMGDTFATMVEDTLHFIKLDKLMFPKHLHGVRELKTDEGEEVVMIGKAYIFVVAWLKSNKIDLNETQFLNHNWANYAEAKKLLKEMYHRDKKAILEEVVDILKNLGHIK